MLSIPFTPWKAQAVIVGATFALLIAAGFLASLI